MKKNAMKLNIITSALYFVIILVYELLYCNYGWITGLDNTYNLSIFRILMYAICYVVYYIFKYKITENVIQSFNNNIKKTITYAFLFITTFALLCIIGSIIILKTILLWQVIAIITILLFDLFLIYITNDMLKNTIIISILLGTIFSISIVANNQLDEKRHFLSAYSLALGNISKTNHTVDTSIANIGRGMPIEEFNKFFNEKPQNILTKEYLTEDICDMPADYYFISYMPSAIGIFLAKNLGGSIADIYFAGRIFNILGYSLLIYLALKIMPYKKKIIYVVAFMPMLLCLSGVYSVDGVTYGVIVIFVAYCLNLYNQQDNITIKQILMLVITFILASIIKGTGYILIGLIVFILPIIKILKQNKKNIWYIILIAIALIAILGSLFFLTYNSEIHDYGDSRSEGTNSKEQLQYILENPIEYMKVLWNHALFSFGNLECLAFLNAPMFFGKTYYNVFNILLILILVIGLTDNSKSFNIKTRIILLLTFISVFVMTSTGLYLSYTKVGASGISGYQMRYLFPIIPLFLVCISNKKFKYDSEKYDDTLVITYLLGSLIFVSIAGVILKMI